MSKQYDDLIIIGAGPGGIAGDGPVFDEAGATNVDGLYLIGDLVVGKKGGSIITAFNSAVRAMKSICIHHLSCQPRKS